MPKVAAEIPEALRPYTFHRVALTVDGSSTQARGECPFCGGYKLYVSIDKGLASCKTCDFNGNSYSFLRRLYLESTVDREMIVDVGKERKLEVSTLSRWGLVQSLIDKEWMLPGYGTEGEVNNLYRWSPVKQKDETYKRRLLGTTGHSHCLFGVESWDASKPDVFILEGPWDAMRFDEVLAVEEELYSKANIVAAPGCETFKDNWVKLFQDKNVILLYDNDRPRKLKNGKINPPAGYTGMRSAAIKLRPVAASIQIINWGESGCDFNLPDGFDMRDCLNTDLVLQ